MDGGAWWAAVHGVAQSQIRLKQLSSSSKLYIYTMEYSVQFSHSVVSNSLQPHGLQHTRLPHPSPTPRAYSNSCPLSWWCLPIISSFVVPFSSHLQSFLASGSFPMRRLESTKLLEVESPKSTFQQCVFSGEDSYGFHTSSSLSTGERGIFCSSTS